MCGIAGYTHLNSRKPSARIRQVTATLHHRGPDQQGIYTSEHVSLGAVRLKIIDLTGGEQPMQSEDGGTVVAFNGEIYNHHELRRELESLGHSFQSRCDTEVALHAFMEWDVDAMSRFRGMFAVAFWQEERRRLVLARDRMGIKPLYLHRRGQELYFGSELKAIFAHPQVERNLDLTALSYYLSLNYVPAPYTLVQGITKLLPGHWLEWHGGAIRTEQYWKLNTGPSQPVSIEEASEELERLLRQSVREHLEADVPVGIWASGGLDSSTILHYAAEASSQQLKTFSVSFKGQKFDESAYFREVASRYGAEHHELDLNPQSDLVDAIEQLPYYSDEPSADAGALPVWFLSRLTRQSVTVALTGDGADELFGGYQTYLADRYAALARLTPRLARQGALGLLRHWPVSDGKISLEYKLKRFLEGSMLPPVEAHFFWNGAFGDADKKRLCLFNGHPKLSGLSGQFNGPSLERFLRLDQNYYLTDDILYKCDRMSMAHSLEVRPPFLDHRIAEFAAKLPLDMKIRGSQLKFLLRRLMRNKLPATVTERRKEGFDIPAHQWFRGPLKALLLDVLSEENVRASGLFCTETVRTLVHNHLERNANLGYHLWGLLTLFLWMRKWNIQTAPAPARESEAAPDFSHMS